MALHSPYGTFSKSAKLGFKFSLVFPWALGKQCFDVSKSQSPKLRSQPPKKPTAQHVDDDDCIGDDSNHDNNGDADYGGDDEEEDKDE